MRILLFMFALTTALSTRAQTYMQVSSMQFAGWQPFRGFNPGGSDSSSFSRKWYFSHYAGVSAGFGIYHGASFNFLSVPLGLQLNHPLNNNLIAFAGISVAPAYFSFGRSFNDPLLYSPYPGINTNAYGLGMNPSVKLGLMYVNDAKTFSISGSIQVDRSTYPVYPSEQMIRKKQ